MAKTQLTQGGYQKLVDELNDLINNKRPKMLDRLAKARAMGDFRENSEYQAAKEDQGVTEGRIQELEALIDNVEIIEAPKGSSNSVQLGSTVNVEVAGKKVTFEIVGEFEADPMNNKLSQSSPIGKALIGKKMGEEVQVQVPAGTVVYKIIAIK